MQPSHRRGFLAQIFPNYHQLDPALGIPPATGFRQPATDVIAK
jgi:hypothetical protein